MELGPPAAAHEASTDSRELGLGVDGPIGSHMTQIVRER
jgi:hypothetical protein